MDFAEIVGNQEIIEVLKEKTKKIAWSFFNADLKQNSNPTLSESRALGNKIRS